MLVGKIFMYATDDQILNCALEMKNYCNNVRWWCVQPSSA